MDHKISKRASRSLSRSDVRLLVSVVSIWEILVKRHAGKLWADKEPAAILDIIRSQSAWRILPLEIAHLQALNEIARCSDHADPFDRMLNSQARSEELRVMTADKQC